MMPITVATQKRHLGASGRLPRRLAGLLAALHVDEHALRHDDGVIDQHPHGDDQRAERDPLHLDIEHAHEEDSAQHRQKQRRPHDHAHAPAHEQHQHRDHDDDRHGEIDDEIVDRLIDDPVLLVDRVDLHPHWQTVLDGAQMRLHRLADGDDVAVGPRPRPPG